LFEPGDQAQARGFARAGRAEHGKELAVLDIDGNPVNGFHFAELPGNVSELDCKRHGAVLQKGEARRSGPACDVEKIAACGSSYRRAVPLIVPTLRGGMQSVTLCVISCE
jgi:hypothetical protein